MVAPTEALAKCTEKSCSAMAPCFDAELALS
jgi:hypothetical protein